MGSQKRVVIIGAGIGGSALALFLRRAGFDPIIYEAREKSEGYWLALGSNGIAILQELGLEQAVLAEGSVVTEAKVLTGQGRTLGRIGLAGTRAPGVFVKRVQLERILHDELSRQEVPLIRGKKLEGIRVHEGGGATATFGDGTQAQGDLLIGCDGVHSRTRSFVEPAFPGAVASGLLNGGGYTQLEGSRGSADSNTAYFIFCRRAFFGYHTTSTGNIYWFTNWPAEKSFEHLAPEAMDYSQLRREMLERYEGEMPIISKIIQNAQEIFPYFASYTLPQQPRSWYKGPVALLGDAAHAISPSSGQGASMALEDALALAKCLRDIPDSENPYRVYQKLRQDRTVKIYQTGVNGDLGKHMITPLKVWWRNLTTPLFLRLFASKKAVRWIYDYPVDWNETING